MARKKELDNLSLEMIECEKAGYGVHYGKWKATQPIKKQEIEEIPDGWKVCPYCGKYFKPKTKIQKYCDAVCCYNAQQKRDKDKKREYDRQYRESKSNGGLIM